MQYIILEKARSHKYIRRFGMPGHYTYVYEEPGAYYGKRDPSVIISDIRQAESKLRERGAVQEFIYRPDKEQLAVSALDRELGIVREPKGEYEATRNFTDEQLTKRIHDDRINNNFKSELYEDLGVQFKVFDPTGMTVDDRLRYMELSRSKRDTYEKDPNYVEGDPHKTGWLTTKYQPEVPFEFDLKDYAFTVRDKMEEGLAKEKIASMSPDEIKHWQEAHPDVHNSDYFITKEIGKEIVRVMSTDDIRAWLKTNGWVVPSGTGKGKLEINLGFDDIIEGLSETQKDELIAKLPQFFMSNKDKHLPTSFDLEPFTTEQLERLSDNFDKLDEHFPETQAEEEEIQEGRSSHSDIFWARSHLWLFTNNYKVARYGILEGWAFSSDTVAQKLLRRVTKGMFDVNKGIQFYEGPKKESLLPQADEIRFSPRFLEHLRQLKAETEEFYKNKFKKKTEPDPDLSKRSLSLLRGIGGAITAYTPAAAESWTTDKWTVDRFGKLMTSDSKEGKYTALKAEATYADVLWSYESAKNWAGWPKEKDLKGKKEFVVLGGGVKNVEAEVREDEKQVEKLWHRHRR